MILESYVPKRYKNGIIVSRYNDRAIGEIWKKTFLRSLISYKTLKREKYGRLTLIKTNLK